MTLANFPLTISAMSLDLPTIEGTHPNRMPFQGVLTRVGVASDKPPEGSMGHRVLLTREAALAAIPSLLGMGVNLSSDMKGHDPQSKIGVISSATLEGDAIHIEGIIYAHDFPAQAAEIKNKKDRLGFSFEAQQIYVDDFKANPWVISSCCFTGAAILEKNSAAYMTTSLAASAQKGTFEMDETEKQVLIDSIMTGVKGIVAPLQTTVDALKASAATTVHANAQTMSMVEPHAAKMEACADGMMAAGIGGHPTNGHAVILRKMAGDLRAAGAMGRVPDAFGGHMYSQASMVEGVTSNSFDVTKSPEYVALKAAADAQKTEMESLANAVKEIKAQARTASTPPQRKTVDASDVQRVKVVMARAGLDEPAEGGKISLGKLNDAMSKTFMNAQERLKTKITLERAGLLDV